MQIQIIRQTTSSPENHASQSQSHIICFLATVSPHSRRQTSVVFVLPLRLRTVTCRPRPLCFNNNSLDPPMRGGGPDMRRCDSSSAANTMAGFSFDCLAGYTPPITFLLTINSLTNSHVCLRILLNHIRVSHYSLCELLLMPILFWSTFVLV